MKEKVYVSVKGLQIMVGDEENSEDVVEVINSGRYNVAGKKEYIRYEEVFEGETQKCSNLIKIGEDEVTVTKKGVVTTHMAFKKGEKTMTFYNTPFGDIYLGIFTRKLDIDRKEDEMLINLEYALEVNYEQVSDCVLEIKVVSKGEMRII